MCGERGGGLLAHVGRQPSLVTCLLAAFSTLAWSELAWFDLQLRVAKAAGALVHEHAHLLAALLLGTPRSVALTRDNLLGHVPLRRHLLQLLPGSSCEASTRVELQLPSCSARPYAAAVAAAGLLVSLVLLLATGLDLRCPFFCAAALNAGLALVSDGPLVLGLAGALSPGVFGCGNWGLLIPASDPFCSNRLLPRALTNLLEELLMVVELRGGQAGGLCFFYNHGGSIRQVVNKIVKAKRGPLGSRIMGGLRRKLCLRRWRTCRRVSAPEVMVLQGHTRFGTSSPASVPETHPHQWIGERLERFWEYDARSGGWMSKIVPFCVTICHNGDFDEWKPYDNHIPNGSLGIWLSRVLNKVNPTKGDSPKLAGVMDLLIAKGVWFRAVRYTYTLLVMTHEEQVCGWASLSEGAQQTMPTDREMRQWAGIFEKAFEQYLNSESPRKSQFSEEDRPGGIGIEELSDRVQGAFDRFCSSASGSKFEELVPEGPVRETFVSSTILAFMQQDVMTSVWQFFCNAIGTFGISVSCTAFPSSILLAAKGQPISVGFNRDRGLCVWTSEPVSLPAHWVGMRDRAVLTRWDLSDSSGEILEVNIVPKTMTSQLMQRHSLFPALEAPLFSLPKTVGDTDPEIDECDYHIVLRGCTMATSPEPVTLGSFARRLVEMSFTKMDSMELQAESQLPGCLRLSKPDPVRADMDQIPFVLNCIDSNWKDKESLNNESAKCFASLVCSLAAFRQTEEGTQPIKTIDVLVTGVEVSHWIGQQFVADLKQLFPMLNCVAISSNFVLGMLQKGAGRVEPLNFPYTSETFKLSKGAVCLALSHSGATYPTVWAARLLKRMGDNTVFAMSGHLDTTLSASLGQSLADPSFNGNIFWTMAGVRPSESATVATVAMHHSLTHLLLITAGFSVDHHINREGYRRLRPCDISDLDRITLSLLPNVEHIVGVTRKGENFQSEAHAALLKAGMKWASHLSEPYWATLLGALYIYVTVMGSVPLVTTVWKHTGEMYIEDLPEEFPRLVYFLDATIYVFLAALISVVHRKLTGRRLWTRYTSRCVVIVDSCTMNYKILRAYITKLRALAFRFTTFSVLGQNPTDHFVHEMTHLTTSEVLVAVGRADGRLASLSSTEASVIMSLQQAKFIKKGSSGIEAMSIGHNPWTNSKLFSRHVPLPMDDRPVFYSELLLQSEQGDVQDTRFDGATPDSVLSRAQNLHFGKKKMANELDVPKLTLGMLKVFLGGRSVLSKNEVRIILQSVVDEQAHELRVDSRDFNAEALIPKTAAEAVNKPWATGAKKSNSPRKAYSEKNSPRKAYSEGYSPKKMYAGEPDSPRSAVSKTSSMGSFDSSGIGKNQMRLTDVMSVVRGEVMKKEMRRMKKNYQKMSLLFAENATADIGPGHLSDIFLAWKDLAMKKRGAMEVHEVEQRAGDWRMMEAYRTVVQKTPVLCFLFGATLLRDTFRAWMKIMVEDKEDTVMVGSHWANAGSSTSQVLAAQQLLENFYETRVAATERLVSFYVLFHRMVRPLSVVPFLGFDMDKTESRLRVASTPAPIAMREPTQGGEDHGEVSVFRPKSQKATKFPSESPELRPNRMLTIAIES